MCGVWVGIAGFSVMLHYVGVRMTWFGYFTPMMICPGILPLIFTVTWNRQTYWAAFISPLVGFSRFGCMGFYSLSLYGEVTIKSTGGQLPALYGSLTSMMLPGVLSIIISLVKPEKFDWDKLKTADLLIGEEEEEGSSPNSQPKNEEGDLNKEKQAGVEVNFESVETSSLEQQQQKLSSQLTNKELDFWIKLQLVQQYLYYSLLGLFGQCLYIEIGYLLGHTLKVM